MSTIVFNLLDNGAINALALVVRMKFLTPRAGNLAHRFLLATTSVPFPEAVRIALGWFLAVLLFFWLIHG